MAHPWTARKYSAGQSKIPAMNQTNIYLRTK